MKSSVQTRAKPKTQAALVSIKALNSIALSQNGKVINPYQPVWNKRKSAVPVAFDSSQATPARLEVAISFDDTGKENFTLEAVTKKSAQVFSGKLQGKGPVTVQFTGNAGMYAKLQQATLNWQLVSEDRKKIITLGATEVDIFFVNLRETMSSVYKKGLPVETLRSLSSILSLTTGADEKATGASLAAGNEAAFVAASTIIQNVFNYVPPRYDVWNGAPHFVTINSWNNITLHYNAYLAAHANAATTLNCYDAAAVLQYALKFYGYATKYCYMQPFGYLKLTNLIGRGQCNNPFYASSGTTAVISQTNTKRTAFGNHAFIYLTSNGAIADACAGPHTGNELPQTYVNNAVDGIVPTPAKVPKGTVANIQYYNGIVSVNFMGSLHEMPELPHTNSFMAKTKFSHQSAVRFASKAIAGKWPEPATCAALENKWRVYYDEIVPGNEEVLKMWMLKRGNQNIMVKLYVISGNNTLAYNRFVSLGSLSQSPDTAYKAGPKGLAHYSAVSDQKGHNRCFWVYHNAVLDITGTNAADIQALSTWFYKWATKNLTDDLRAHLPAAEVEHSSLRPKVGERLYVSLASGDNLRLDFEHREEGLRLITEEEKNLVFDAVKPFKNDLKVLVIDKETLLVNTATLQVEAGK